MSDFSETLLEIDLRALEHNYHCLRSKLKAKTKFLGVVKAYAYGSDSVEIAKKLEKLGADYLAVAYTYEGVHLRKAGIKIPILVFHAQPKAYPLLIENCLEPNIYSLRVLQEFIKAAENLKQSNYPIHLKFNTGLNRIGLAKKDIASIRDMVGNSKAVHIVSIFSHLAASDDVTEKEFTLNQIRLFEEQADLLCKELLYQPLIHILNTSGIFNYADAQFDMVRSGIGLYGYGNERRYDKELKIVATLKTTISQILHVKPNETVGYNRAFRCTEATIIATLPIGHADGIGRQYGNGKTTVTINGKDAPIVGNVCMDMIMVDITNIPCKEGDTVIIFGKQKSAEDFAKTANTISYELLCGISQRVTRTFIVD